MPTLTPEQSADSIVSDTPQYDAEALRSDTSSLTRERSAMASVVGSIVSDTPPLSPESQYDVEALRSDTSSPGLPIGTELISMIRNLNYYFHMLDWVSQRESQPSPVDGTSCASLSGQAAEASSVSSQDTSHCDKKRKVDTSENAAEASSGGSDGASHPDTMSDTDATNGGWQRFSVSQRAIVERIIELICLNCNMNTVSSFEHCSKDLTDAFLAYHQKAIGDRQIALRVTLIDAFKNFMRKPIDDLLALQDTSNAASLSNDAGSSSSSSSSSSSNLQDGHHLPSSAAADPLNASLNPLSEADLGRSLRPMVPNLTAHDSRPHPAAQTSAGTSATLFGGPPYSAHYSAHLLQRDVADESDDDMQQLHEDSDEILWTVSTNIVGPWFIQSTRFSLYSPFEELKMLFDLCVESTFIDNNKEETDIVGYLKTLNNPQFEFAINHLISLIDTSDSTSDSHAAMTALGAEQLDDATSHDFRVIEENIGSIANELLDVDDDDHRHQSLERLAQFMDKKYPFVSRALFIMADELDTAEQVNFNELNVAGTVTTACETEVTYELNRKNSRAIDASLNLAMTPDLRPTHQRSIIVALDVSKSMGQGSGSNMDQVITANQELLRKLHEQQLSSQTPTAEPNEPPTMATSTHAADSASLSSAAEEPMTDPSNHRPHTESASLDLVVTNIIFGKGAKFLEQIILPHAANVDPELLDQVRKQTTQQIDQLPERISSLRTPLLYSTKYRGVFDTIVQRSCYSAGNVTDKESSTIPQGSNVFILTDGKPTDCRTRRDEAKLPGIKDNTVVAIADDGSTGDETHDENLLSWVKKENLVRINPKDASPIFIAAEGLLAETVQHLKLEVTFKNPASSNEPSRHYVFWIPCSGENTDISLPIPQSVLMTQAIIELTINDQALITVNNPRATIHSDESPWGNSSVMTELVMRYRHDNAESDFNRMATSSWGGGHPGLEPIGSPTIPEALLSLQSSQTPASQRLYMEHTVDLMRESSTADQDPDSYSPHR